MCSHGIDRREGFCVDCATPEELRAEVASLNVDLAASVRDWNEVHPARVREIEEAQADNERLRALIKAAEWKAEWCEAGGACPWCDAINTHAATCPAFATEGRVR